MIVDLPISSFSRKIIRKFDDRDPLPIRQNNVLHPFFGTIRHHVEIYDGRSKQYLTEIIKVDLGIYTRKRSLQYMNQVGVAIHRYHLRTLMIFIESQVINGGLVTAALNQFYSIYGLTDDDLDMETAMRQWTRYFSSRKAKINNDNYLKNSRENRELNLRNHQYNEEDIYEKLSDLIFHNIIFFKTSNGICRKLILHFTIYYYRKYQSYHQKDLSKICGLGYGGIYYAIKNVEGMLEVYKPLNDYMTKSMKN